MRIFRPISLIFTLVGIMVTTATAWFVPWVFTFHLGVLVYFPYHPDGVQRFTRVTGPFAGSYKKNWIAGKDIPKACKLALVAAEDTKFFIHRGIDLESLEKSYEYNQRKKKAKRGGSTITQQLVKNAFLSRDRSYLRKAREIVGAVLLDAISSKDMQLNWYFNIVEFGPNIYGLKDAAQFYFRKTPSALSQRECASLVAILPSPNKWNKSIKSGSPSGFLTARVRTILARMKVIPTINQAIEGSGPIAANNKKKTNTGLTDGGLPNSTVPQPPLDGLGVPTQSLEQAELQAEKAEQLTLPEEEAKEAWPAEESDTDSPPNPERETTPQAQRNAPGLDQDTENTDSSGP